MTEPAAEFRDVTKTYGEVRALAGLSLDVAPGTVTGLLGPNGAGKTTAIRLLLGLARPTSGTVRALGTEVTTGAHPEIGYLPDVPGFPAHMTAAEWMDLTARLYRLPCGTAAHRSAALLEIAGLAGVMQRIGAYSRGMRQRLGIAQALLPAPRLLVLDEPTSALDPLGRKDVLEMIASLRGRTTVLLSSHLLDDVERVCDHVAVMDKGRALTAGTVDELRETLGGSRRIVVVLDGDPAPLAAALASQPWCESASADGSRLTVVPSDDGSARRALPGAIAEAGLGLVSFGSERASLEDLFVRLVEAER